MVSTPSIWTRTRCVRSTEVSPSCATFPKSSPTRPAWASAEINWNTLYGTLLSATSLSEIQPRELSGRRRSALEPFGLGVSPSDPAGAIGHHSDQQETQEMRFTSNRIGALEFIAGTFPAARGSRGRQHLSRSTPPAGPPAVSESVGIDDKTAPLNEAAGYFNATYYILPQLDLTVGTRYSRIKQRPLPILGGLLYTGSATSFLTNAQRLLGEPQDLLGRHPLADELQRDVLPARGERLPSGRRPYDSAGRAAGFSPSYVSDSIWSYEAGVKVRALDDRLSLDADGFWINWTNIQSLVYIGQFNTDGNGGRLAAGASSCRPTMCCSRGWSSARMQPIPTPSLPRRSIPSSTASGSFSCQSTRRA